MEGCPERGKTLGRLREHFMYRHWNLKVAIMKEVPEPLPRCDQYGVDMPTANNLKHSQSYKCHNVTDRRL